ncbi:CotH kinase family protein [Bacteroidota bacterium]
MKRNQEGNSMIPFRISYLISLIFFTNMFSGYAQYPVINELLASNATINRDADYASYSDWIELYNPGYQTIGLSGFFLTDDLNDTTKWVFPPGITIGPEGYLLVWADGKDSINFAIHTNFNLQKEGEGIYLFNASRALIDSVIYSDQKADISYGRQPDGSEEWVLFSIPTPGDSNNTEIYKQAIPPDFSLEGGFFTEDQILEFFMEEENAIIRYTLNGSEPDETSTIYTGPISLKNRLGDPNIISEISTNADPYLWLPGWIPPAGEVFKATTVRARVFKDGYLPSDIITNTYFIDKDIHNRYPTIPIISIVTDYDHLFNDTTGIYVPGITHVPGNNGSGNYFQDWERPAHIEFFEVGGELGFAQDVGIRIQGGTSPASPQKGLHVIARSEYGKNRIDYPIFSASNSKANQLTEYKRLIIRAWGSLITGNIFNDAYAHRLMENSDLDIQAYRPAVVFINGEYWGLHELREANKNSWYYQYHYDINRDDPGFDILVHGIRNGAPYAWVDEGDNKHWDEIKSFINTQDLSLEENYEYIKSMMDIDNFIAYMGHCIYVGKWDWPNNNEASWRPRTEDGRWRWVQFDMETGFGVATGLGPIYQMLGVELNMIKHVIDGVEIPNFGTYGPQPLLVKLLENYEFKVAFINWFGEHLNNEFSPEVTNNILNEMIAELSPYVEEYRNRWPFIADLNATVEEIRSFNRQRPEIVNNHIKEYFNTDDNLQLAESQLFQNYPNPFNNSTSIRYQLPLKGTIKIRIIDLNGKELISYSRYHDNPGIYSFYVNVEKYRSGMYYYIFEAENFTDRKKMMILK